ncbi:HAD-IA family hydrolase [Salinisphaera sp. USBA-960]|uniref:HAD-IA family hydrolase n=1 Tax=Salinisphaera orenii TaxID=856731 RepID=UPI000DBE1305|nr:HAD-IA family hydrolase [Salifodinibacter halophilus]NNC25546.1 HAD-IA family hydrolase [Salifodinibacter halophilus]
MALAALLFDVDGTLADTEADGHRPAYNRAFAAHGLDWYWSSTLYQELLAVSGGIPRLSWFLDTYRPSLGVHAAAYRHDPGAWIRALHRQKARYFRRQVVAGRVALRPGVKRLIEGAIAAGIHVGLVSNASRATVDALEKYCVQAALGDVISLTISGDDVLRPKPDPMPYTLACERLGVDPACALALEDSPVGLTSALAAGLPTLVTTSDETRDRSFPGAVAVVDSLDHPGRPAGADANAGDTFERVDIDVLRSLHVSGADTHGSTDG